MNRPSPTERCCRSRSEVFRLMWSLRPAPWLFRSKVGGRAITRIAQQSQTKWGRSVASCLSMGGRVRFPTIMFGGGATRAEVYYPVSRRNRIGYVLRVDTRLDAVVALLDGRGFDSYTRFLDTPRGPRAIRRSSEPVLGSRVSKTGATTGLTEGVVAQAAGDSYYVVPLAGATGQVSDGGDSGSIVVDSNDEAVGLLWGGDILRRPGQGDYFAMRSMVRIQESLGFVWTP